MLAPTYIQIDVSVTTSSAKSYKEDLKHRFDITSQVARENNAKAQEKYKAQYNKNTASPTFKLGQQVLLYSPQNTSGKVEEADATLARSLLHN